MTGYAVHSLYAAKMYIERKEESTANFHANIHIKN